MFEKNIQAMYGEKVHSVADRIVNIHQL